ncbi:MAG: DUF1236 domain-containing protein [Rhodobacteraceae bacterium]|nr:DUF1236 domain-containing protein [Paracoccaceae bacterium]
MRMNSLAALSATAMLMAPAAFAQTAQATIVTNGPLLQGPGTQYTIIGQPPVNSPVMVQGCLASNDWCEVEMNGQTGWMSAADLGVTTGSGQVLLSQPNSETSVSTLTYDQRKVNHHAAGGALAGAAVGAAVGGPVGAAVGAVVGAAGGAATTAPDRKVTTYVTQNPVAPVTVPGNVAVGTVVPNSVTLTPVPDSRYSYMYLDGQPVVVENQSRTVVRILQ